MYKPLYMGTEVKVTSFDFHNHFEKQWIRGILSSPLPRGPERRRELPSVTAGGARGCLPLPGQSPGKGTQFEERGKGFPYIVIHYIVGLGEWRREKKKKEEEKGPEKKQREAGGAEKQEKGKRHQKKTKSKTPKPTQAETGRDYWGGGTRAASHRKRQRVTL